MKTGATVIRAYSQTQRFITESEARVDTNQSCYYPRYKELFSIISFNFILK